MKNKLKKLFLNVKKWYNGDLALLRKLVEMLKECILDMVLMDVMNQTDDIFKFADIKLMIKNMSR